VHTIWGHHGSVHTWRYINIAKSFANSNALLPINQNFGEAVYVTIFLKLGLTNLEFCITLTIAVVASFFTLLIVEFLKQLKFSNTILALSAIVLVACNCAPTLDCISIVDIVNPFIIIGYLDSYWGLAAFLILLYTGYHVFIQKTIPFTYTILLVVALLYFSNHIYAIYNIVLIPYLVLLGVLVYYYYYKKWNKALMSTGLVLCLTGSMGLSFGGMLLSPKNVKLQSPEVMTAYTQNNTIRIAPYMVYKQYSSDTITYPNYDQGYALHNSVINKSKKEKWILFSEWTITNLATVFFLCFYLFIIIIANFLLLKKYSYPVKPFVQFLLPVSIGLFVPAFIIAYFFEINSYKRELNRFLYPFIVTSLLLAAPVIQYYYNRNLVSRLILLFLIVISCCPVFLQLYYKLSHR
jgi:hypothetical protein